MIKIMTKKSFEKALKDTEIKILLWMFRVISDRIKRYDFPNFPEGRRKNYLLKECHFFKTILLMEIDKREKGEK